ncbi:MAG: substrate-binding domain-containing protein [Deltaproteobacteria bacterium]|jgi:ABC-type molybdate transport system substrate-binding protein|nr:substrate-binding domain-containing protein [Deltaproteobacteria bacterium]MBT4526684.1 substrate-binding domain-containing protein [Deltaproteobacteria bacterium]
MKQSNNEDLDWPEEICSTEFQYGQWNVPRSNICLDFHGDPARSELIVFSDGNHHMALLECLEQFKKENPDLSGVFYATTPPGPVVNVLESGGIQLGNLMISAFPHVFISPPEVLEKLVKKGYISGHTLFCKNQGAVLIVKKGNPKGISTINDLARKDVRFFISNPKTEQASFLTYQKTLAGLTSEFLPDSNLIDLKVAQGNIKFGKAIHHREAPQALAEDSVDAAIVFYHLALRYTRIFPETFDMIPLGGSIEEPKPYDESTVTDTHMGLVNDGGKWGKQLVAFLNSKSSKKIYKYHGLCPM